VKYLLVKKYITIFIRHFDYDMFSLKFRFSDIENPFDSFITNNKEPILAKIKKYPFLGNKDSILNPLFS